MKRRSFLEGLAVGSLMLSIPKRVISQRPQPQPQPGFPYNLPPIPDPKPGPEPAREIWERGVPWAPGGGDVAFRSLGNANRNGYRWLEGTRNGGVGLAPDFTPQHMGTR